MPTSGWARILHATARFGSTAFEISNFPFGINFSLQNSLLITIYIITDTNYMYIKYRCLAQESKAYDRDFRTRYKNVLLLLLETPYFTNRVPIINHLQDRFSCVLTVLHHGTNFNYILHIILHQCIYETCTCNSWLDSIICTRWVSCKHS